MKSTCEKSKYTVSDFASAGCAERALRMEWAWNPVSMFWGMTSSAAFELFFSFYHRVSQVFRKNNIYIKGQLAAG